MIRFQIGTGRGKKALSVLTDALTKLFFAGGMSEIGRRASHVMNISLKIGLFKHFLRFPYERFMASYLHNPSLMKGQSAEITAAKTPSVTDKRKSDLRDGRHTARRLVGGMVSAHIRQVVDIVHFLHGKRRLRRILYHIKAVRIWLNQSFSRERIRILILCPKTVCIALRLRLHFFIGRQHDAVKNAV